MNTLYVGGLPPQTDADALRSLFSRFGRLRSVRIIRRQPGGPHRGFGYVTFADSNSARAAQRSLNGAALNNTPLRVALAS